MSKQAAIEKDGTIIEALSNAMSVVPKDAEKASMYYRNEVIPVME